MTNPKNDMRNQISIIFTILLTISACTSQIEATSYVTPLFEDAISQTPSFTLAPPAASTNDIKPTFTKTSTPEPSRTIPQSTVDAMATLDSLAGTYPELKSNWGGSISPNANWAAFHTFAENQNVLKLLEINGDKQWEINFFDIYGSQHEYFDGSVGSVSIGHWSKDGTYVYLEPHPEWDGPGLWFGSGATLIRFNLNNGTWVDLNIGNSWSISSNEKYLVYSGDDGVHLRTLFDGSEKIFAVPEKFESFGRFVWSPENRKFAFTAAYGDWHDGKTGFSAFLVDVKDFSMISLFEDDLRLLYPREWVEAEKIVLHQYQHNDKYYFDLVTKQIGLIPSP